MEQINEALVNLLIVVIGSAVTVVSAKLTQFIKNNSILSQLDTKKELASTAVDAVEQMSDTEDAMNKYNSAKVFLVQTLKERGISFTDKEIRFLIEQAVLELKKEEK